MARTVGCGRDARNLASLARPAGLEPYSMRAGPHHARPRSALRASLEPQALDPRRAPRVAACQRAGRVEMARPAGLEPATLGLEGCVPVSEAPVFSTGLR